MFPLRNNLLFTTLLLLFVARLALSDENRKEEAKRHFVAGNRLFEVENFKGARVEFESSVRLFPTKSGYFNLANCYKALYRYRESLSAIHTLETRFGTELDETMRQKIDSLKSLILSLVGTLKITVSPADATVLIDGQPLTKEEIRRPIQLGPGPHQLEVSLKDFQAEHRQLVIHSGETQSLTVALHKLRGTVTLLGNLDGTTLVVDDTPPIVSPQKQITLPPGEHRLSLAKPGYNTRSWIVDVPPNGNIAIDFQLIAESKPQSKPAPVVPASDLKTTDDATWPLFPYKLATLAGTVVAASLSGAFYGIAAKNASDFHTYDDAYLAAPNRSKAATFDIKRRDAKADNRRFSAFGLGFAIGTGVMGAAFAALWLLPQKKESKSSALSITPSRVALSF